MDTENSLTEYERRRLENVKRNQAMLAALGVQHSVDDIRSNSERAKSEQKGYKRSLIKRPRDEPIVLRRSLRAQGLSSDTEIEIELNDDLPTKHGRQHRFSSSIDSSIQLNPALVKEHLPFSSVYLERERSSDSIFLDRLRTLIDDAPIADWSGSRNISVRENAKASQRFIPGSLSLRDEDVARMVPGRIFSVAFLPLRDRIIVAAGDKGGHLGLWDVDCDDSEGDGVYIYQPHGAPVSGIAIPPGNASKVLSCSYDGTVRSMDVENMKFDLVYATEDEILSALCFLPGNPHCAYIAEADGELKVLDTRDCTHPSCHSLHSGRINTIHFNPQRTCLMATSSSDRTSCIWDIRSMRKGVKSLWTVRHNKPVYSAYFSPSGSHLATCSMDNRIGLLSGFYECKKIGLLVEDKEMIYHNNMTGRWICPFRAIWGWDDNYIYAPNLNRSIDVISTSSRNVAFNLVHSRMTAISCRLASHPLVEGTIAGSTGGGQVYIWRK